MPEGSKKSRLVAFKDTSGDDSTFLQFPEIDGAGYLVVLFREAGLAMSNGMAAIPLTWQEIESWLKVTELELTVWEKMTIREMSEAYASELSNSSSKHAVAPYMAPVEELKIDRTAVSDKLRSVLGGFKRKKPEQA